MAGQSLRVVVGLKKLNDDASDAGKRLKDVFVGSRMVVSLLIGFVAGLLGILSISSFKADFFSGTGVKQVILSLVAAGYAGTDFIEGFITKFLPGTTTTPAGADTTVSTNGVQPPPDAYKKSPSKTIPSVIAVPQQGAINHP
jgi:hypothetical protein